MKGRTLSFHPCHLSSHLKRNMLGNTWLRILILKPTGKKIWIPALFFFDTLFVKPEDSIYSSFWWASNPNYHLLVLNSEDYFLRIGRKNSANGQVLYFATPQVMASFAEPFESFFSNHNYNSFITYRTTCLDTLQDTIVNSYMFISDTINGSIHYYEELKIDQFGIRSKNFFNENIQNSSDIINQYQKVKKVKTLY